MRPISRTRTETLQARQAVPPCLAGFTLIELVVVMVILAVGALLVTPAVRAGAHQREVRRTLQHVQAIVRRASALALVRRRRVELVLSPEEGAFVLRNPGAGHTSEDASENESDAEQARVEIADFATIDDIEGGRLEDDGTVVFDFLPTGACSGGRFTIRFADRPGGRLRQAYVVTIDPLTSAIGLEEAG